MQAVHGSFFVEDRSGTGSKWTAEDAARLEGRRGRPHVMTDSGPIWIGVHAQLLDTIRAARAGLMRRVAEARERCGS